jgi:hypothetical protein
MNVPTGEEYVRRIWAAACSLQYISNGGVNVSVSSSHTGIALKAPATIRNPLDWTSAALERMPPFLEGSNYTPAPYAITGRTVEL